VNLNKHKFFRDKTIKHLYSNYVFGGEWRRSQSFFKLSAFLGVRFRRADSFTLPWYRLVRRLSGSHCQSTNTTANRFS